MNFSTSSINLSDSISGYMTANEEECDNSQYLSVLNEDLTLEEMNVTLTNEKQEDSIGTELVPVEDTNQPFIFKVDGSNEIYSVQVAQDEEGNLQKYQIQYSGNMNGELVPMLETIQFLPLEYEEEVISEEHCSTIEVPQPNEHFIVANEQFIPQQDDFNIENTQEEQTTSENGWNQTPFEVSVKNEHEHYYEQCSILTAENCDVQNPVELVSIDTNTEDIGINDSEDRPMAVQHIDVKPCIDREQLYEETIEETQFEQLFLEEKHDDIFQIANENVQNVYDGSVLKESVDRQPDTNVLKKSSQRSLLKDFVNSEQRIIYVQTLPEKENLKVVDIESFIKPSSRSLLKCNQPPQITKQVGSCTKDKNPTKNPSARTTPRIKEAKPVQTCGRTKESKQARQFLNFINSTTIPQVPERKERLPRKQQIKPYKHQNEDIVVKEMLVSSKGFVEPVSAEERKHLPVTEYVELIDSGDELNPSSNNNKKKRKNNQKDEPIEIEISDTDESDALETEDNKNGTKKKRGRPPKSKTQDKKTAYPSSPPKISRLDCEVEDVTSTLEIVRMEDQTESGPKKDSSDDFSKNTTTEKKDVNKKCAEKEVKGPRNCAESIIKYGFEYKFECEKCKSKFINKFLLNRHECKAKLTSNFACDICKQKFSSNSNLVLHKKNHVKETNSTKIPKVKVIQAEEVVSSSSNVSSSRFSAISKGPLKIPSRPSILPPKNARLAPSVKSARATLLPLKGKVSAPLKSVGSLSRIFPSQSKNDLAKSASTVSLEPTVKAQNEFKPASVQVTPEKTPKSYSFKCEKQCTTCSKQFDNNSEWFDHQVLHHGFKTPDKSIGEKKQRRIVKDKVTHNGIRAGPTVAKSFSVLRNKVQQI